MSMYFQIYLNDKRMAVGLQMQQHCMEWVGSWYMKELLLCLYFQFGNFNTEFKSIVEKNNGEDYKNVSVQKHPVIGKRFKH